MKTSLGQLSLAMLLALAPSLARAAEAPCLTNAEAVGDKMKPKDCTLIDAILEQLEPLPADNMARLIGIAMREGGKPRPGEAPKKNPLRICGGEGGV